MLTHFENKSARVECRIALKFPDEKPLIFYGSMEGTMVEPRGNNDFLWDPIFKPADYQCTYAEMDSITKNQISDRGIAIRSLLAYLNSLKV